MYVLCFKTTRGEVVGEGIGETILMITSEFLKLGDGHVGVRYISFLIFIYICIFLEFKCRIDAFELWCWRRLLRVPWTARRSSQSILKEISPGISLEGMMLRLKLQYFGHLMRGDSLEKTLMLGGIGGRRRRG